MGRVPLFRPTVAYAWTPRQQRMEVEKGFPDSAEQPTACYSYINKVLWYTAKEYTHTHTQIYTYWVMDGCQLLRAAVT